ncbi:MAG: hypothetical protein ABIQ64_04265 [Candidatus Saccharimonadales bacterium]
MKLLHSSKMFITVIIAAALLVGFGTTFAISSMMDHDKATEVSHHDDDQTHVTNSDHGGGQNASIVTDSSLSTVKADKNIDLFADKASPEEVYLTVGQVLQFNTKDDNKHRIALGQGGTEHEHISATNSGDFGANEAWRVRFDKVGTYFFHDHHNPNINVLVVVYQPGAKQGI